MSTDKPEESPVPRDVTILRPRPGAGRRPTPPPSDAASSFDAPAPTAAAAPNASGRSSDSAQAPGLDHPQSSQSSIAAPRAAPIATPSGLRRGPDLPVSLGAIPGTSVNPLLHAAVPLLVLAGRLRSQISNADLESLHRQAITEIGTFEQRSRYADMAAEDVLAARYALCTVIDEAVLNTPWGAQSDWSTRSLLVTFHREAAGGEKFFQIIDRVSGEPQRYVALLELLYACLAIGFEGKYRLDDRGAMRLADIREALFRRIEGQRGGVESDLSPRWKGVEDRRNAVMRFVPLWVAAAACAVLLVGAYIWFDSRLSELAEPVNATLARVGLDSLDPVTPPSPGVATSGLRTLLAQQIASGTVSVEESGDRTLITLTTPDLFASGSDRINAVRESLVHEVARALNSVPGRILVIGHTDDQPLRSFRFKDNYELSRSRALQVADLLRADVKDAARIEAAGKGALEPRYQPASDPANRARNRRVEIIHRRNG